MLLRSTHSRIPALSPIPSQRLSANFPAMSPALLDGLFWASVVSCAVAQLFILRAVFRTLPPRSPSADAPNVPMPHRLQEIVWAILPAFLLAAAFIWAWRAMHPISPQ